jgi:hypothetical protein
MSRREQTRRRLEQNIDTTIMIKGNRNRQSALGLVVIAPEKDVADIKRDVVHRIVETAGCLGDKLTAASLTSAMRFEFSVVSETHTNLAFIQ